MQTSGVQADAVFLSDNSNIDLNLLKVTTTGNAAKGLNVEGAYSLLTAQNVTISTSGGID